jgi:hypothetical protein
MVLQHACFKTALSIGDMETKFRFAHSFLFDSSCIDTQPPLPPGAGG